MITLRGYQQEAKQAIIDYWSSGGGNPLVDLATGTGKSMVIASLVQDLVQTYDARIVMLVHVRELVEQNFKALLKVWPDAPAGIYSAGLGRRDAHHRITFASIQSVFKKAPLLGRRDIVLVDEAHLVPTAGNGMYRTLLDGLRERVPDLRVAGFTATPYRLDSGRLDKGGDRLFDETVYSYDIAKGIDDQFLSPLISKASMTEIDVADVQRRGGEFVAGSLETAADKITAEAVTEMLKFGQDRKSWLIFCSGVKHAMHVRDTLRMTGISCETITGETPAGERDRIIRDYRAGRIRALTNANVLTTGFDAPSVDMVAMLRPTLSVSLYVQIVGRGTRIAPEKTNCLILDFAGNVRRHGPVDSVTVTGRGGGFDDTGKVGVDEVRAKACPVCEALAALNARTCRECGHEWPHEEKPKHDPKAESELGIMSTEKVPPQQLPVVDWSFRVYRSDMGEALEVNIMAGLNSYREWAAFDGASWRRQKGCEWWMQHGGAAPFPMTAQEALDRIGELTMPMTVTVARSLKKPKYFNIVGRSFPAKQRSAAA